MNKFSLAKKCLNNSLFYSLAKIGIKIGVKGFMRDLYLYFLQETRDAYQGKRPVIWCSTFVPSELIYAVGGVPFMPEIASGFTSALGQADELLADAEGDWLNADLCSIHRCGTGLMKRGLLPEPDMMIASTHLCDGAKKYLQQLSYHYQCPFYLLETPYKREDAPWLADQLRDLVKKIKTSRPDFKKVFSLSNQSYYYQQKINQIRKQKPALISGDRFLNLVSMAFMSFGSKKGVDYYRKLAETLNKRLDKNDGLVPEERFRLLWLHLKPYYAQEIFSTLREEGAVVAFEEYNQLYWQPLNSNHPYLSLAEKMIDHFGWGSLNHQIEKILELIEDYNIDGVIGFSQWGCHQNSGRLDKIKKDLRSKDIPFLKIEGDLVDGRNYREGQLITRIQAFLEMMEVKKGDLIC